MHWQDPGREAIEAWYGALEPFWHPVTRSMDLEDRPEAVQLLGRQLVLARLEGEVVAMDDLCRHLGAALSRGQILEGRALRCGYHGWTYDKGGRCVDIPLRRDATIPEGARVRRYLAQEAYGLVWVCLAEAPSGGLPAYPEFSDPQFHKGPLVRHTPLRTSAQRMVMSALDDTHFPWVHDKLLGDASSPRPPRRIGEHAVRREDGHLVSIYETDLPANPLAKPADATSNGKVTEWETVRFVNYATPSTIKNVIYGEAGITVTWNALTPSAYNHTLVFTQLSRTYDRDAASDEQYEEFNLLVKLQDKDVIEGQRPWLLPPLSAHLALYVRPDDLPLIEYQKWMEELGVPQL